MIAIACVDKNLGIGKNNQLLIKIPEDLEYFKNQTLNSIVIMGRKTLFSFKNQKPLPDRINIVLTHNLDLKNSYREYENSEKTKIFFVDNKIKIINLLKNFKNKKCFVIGGESIYRLFLEEFTTILLTEVNYEFNADSFFPKFDKNKFLKIPSNKKIFNGIEYEFCEYILKK